MAPAPILYGVAVFQSTRPARGATCRVPTWRRIGCWFQSTRPARGATPGRRRQGAGSRVSIHAPRAGRDLADETAELPGLWFQSTRPARGATSGCSQPPCIQNVSIHAPRAGRDRRGRGKSRRGLLFQSTRPARGATPMRSPDFGSHLVSIHAPRAGRDGSSSKRACSVRRFNPRAPRGARLDEVQRAKPSDVFQSTRPARGATSLPVWFSGEFKFQSTRPARGATGPSATATTS